MKLYPWRFVRRAGPIGLLLAACGCAIHVHVLENVKYPTTALPIIDVELQPLPTTQPVTRSAPRTDHFGAFMRNVP